MLLIGSHRHGHRACTRRPPPAYTVEVIIRATTPIECLRGWLCVGGKLDPQDDFRIRINPAAVLAQRNSIGKPDDCSAAARLSAHPAAGNARERDKEQSTHEEHHAGQGSYADEKAGREC